MSVRRVGAFIAVVMVVAALDEAGAQAPQPPVIDDLKVTSLHKGRTDWDVVTSFCIEAKDPDSKSVTFEVISPAASGDLDCKKSCTPFAAAAGGTRATRCEYKPRLGFVGLDTFKIQGTDDAMLKSPAATVNIDVKNEGLRWELLAAGSTGLTSDTGSPADIPKVLGKDLQDFLFVLNWQTASPRQKPLAPIVPVAGGPAPVAPLVATGKFSRLVNVVFQTGLQSGSAAVTPTQVGVSPTTPTTPTTPAAGAAPAETGTKSAAVQRQFTAGGHVNYSGVIDADGQGTFVEIGVTGKAAVDVFVEGDVTQQVTEGKFVELLRSGDTFFRGEGGLRIGLKRYKENSSVVRSCPGAGAAGCPPAVGAGQQVLHPSNLDDLVYVELLFQRNNALANLAATGDSRNRYAVRIAAQPQLAKLPGRPKFLIGLEVSHARGGEPITKVFYGMNLSGNKLF